MAKKSQGRKLIEDLTPSLAATGQLLDTIAVKVEAAVREVGKQREKRCPGVLVHGQVAESVRSDLPYMAEMIGRAIEQPGTGPLAQKFLRSALRRVGPLVAMADEAIVLCNDFEPDAPEHVREAWQNPYGPPSDVDTASPTGPEKA